MRKIHTLGFLDEDPEITTQGGEFDASKFSNEGPGDDSGASDDSSADGGEDDNGAAPPGRRTLDADTAAFILERMSQGGGQQQRQAPVQYTPEQIAKALNAVTVGEEDIKELFDNNTTMAQKAAALQKIIDRVSLHAQTLSGVTTKMGLQAVQNQFSPVFQAYERQVNKEFEVDLNKQYPALAKFDKVTAKVIKEMKAEPESARLDYPSAMAEVARRVGELISAATGQPFDLKAAGAAKNQPPNHGMQQLGGPAGGGSGAGGQSNNRGNDAQDWQKALSPVTN